MKKLPYLAVTVICFLLAGPAMATRPFSERSDVQAFIEEMQQRHGFQQETLQALFRQVHTLPAVIKAIKPPADPSIRSWSTYRSRFIEPRRLAAAQIFWHEHAAALASASARYGVPEEVIVAIIGIETIYGRNTGRFGTVSALATLAFDYPPRAPLFRRELEALLLLAREQQRDPLSYRGSYAGALGLPQFLPSSVRQWAVDFDGNGEIDLLASPQDAIGSVAHFLQAHGWQTGAPVTQPVSVASAEKAQALLDEGIRPVRLPAAMAAFGVEAPGAVQQPAALIDLVTPGQATEYWLGYQNFFTITRYNKSSFYAMSVFQFAEAIRADR